MEEIIKEVQNHLISTIIKNLVEEGKLDDFLEFAREKAKEDGMDTEELMKFFDELEESYCDNIDWIKVVDIIAETVNDRKVMKFKDCIVIENRMMSNGECENYMETEVSPIHLGNLNKALKEANVKLEFIEAINNPFDICGFNNFCRFKVVELE